MGIPFFFGWLADNYPDIIQNLSLKNGQVMYDQCIDNLYIDMNGIFHPVCQKVYQYGDYKPKPTLFNIELIVQKSSGNLQTETFIGIIKKIEEIITIVNPKKRIILCIDGVAGMGKIRQQRQRRFLSTPVNEEEFDPNCISPGTVWMKDLCTFIKKHIRKERKKWGTQHYSIWNGAENIIFSSDRVPGEGEHKLISYIKWLSHERNCIHGLDADLIMLSLSVHSKNQYIIRDNIRPNIPGEYKLLFIDKIREHLIENLTPVPDTDYIDSNSIINDFIAISFLIGNDFLPHSPSLEIVLGGMGILFDTYRTILKTYGYITVVKPSGIKFNILAFKEFLKFVSEHEKECLENKIQKGKHIHDSLLEEFVSRNEGKVTIDFDKYREKYYREKIPEKNIKDIVQDYIKGMQWVLTYYSEKIPSWRWNYPHYYAPFVIDILEHMSDTQFKYIRFPKDKPLTPNQQLMCILPPHSSNLLPKELAYMVHSSKKIEIKIDYAGKFREWEGIVLLPQVNLNLILDMYNKSEVKEDNFDEIVYM